MVKFEMHMWNSEYNGNYRPTAYYKVMKAPCLDCADVSQHNFSNHYNIQRYIRYIGAT